MRLVVISTDGDEPREIAVLMALFAAGLERYHVRKPKWPKEKLAAWLKELPTRWRARLVLHQHHDLVAELGLGGRHWRDDGSVLLEPPASSENPFEPEQPGSIRGFTSRACHDLPSLDAVLGRYDAALLGPIYPSISKEGRRPDGAIALPELHHVLRHRTDKQKRTEVIALGGLTAANAPRCRDFGFDGVATLGAVWKAADPVRAYQEIRSAILHHAS